jgi:hypothetical protein
MAAVVVAAAAAAAAAGGCMKSGSSEARHRAVWEKKELGAARSRWWSRSFWSIVGVDLVVRADIARRSRCRNPAAGGSGEERNG